MYPVFVQTTTKASEVADSIRVALQSYSSALRKPNSISEQSWTYLQGITSGSARHDRLRAISELISQWLAQPYRSGVINVRKSQLPKHIAIQKGESVQDVVDVAAVFDSLQLRQMLEENVSGKLSPPEASIALEVLAATVRPTLMYSASLSDLARASAKQSVARSNGVVSQGEILAWPGQRITDEVKAKILSLQRSEGLHDERSQSYKQVLGNLGYVLMLLALGAMYLFYFRPRILQDNLQVGIICSALVLIAVHAWLSVVIHVSLPIEFLIPIPLFSMLIAILFDSRTAFYLTVVACFMVAGIRGNDFAVAIACLVAGVLAAYTVRGYQESHATISIHRIFDARIHFGYRCDWFAAGSHAYGTIASHSVCRR